MSRNHISMQSVALNMLEVLICCRQVLYTFVSLKLNKRRKKCLKSASLVLFPSLIVVKRSLVGTLEGIYLILIIRLYIWLNARRIYDIPSENIVA